jgi:hypothetical protein
VAREHALEELLLACDNWDAWLRVFIAANPEMDLPTVRHQMTARSSSANSDAERERADARGIERLRSRIVGAAGVSMFN